jgi:biopolymer transport protein ExbD
VVAWALWAAVSGQAQEPRASVDLVPVQRAPGGTTIYLRADGQIFVEDALVEAEQVTSAVQARLAGDPAQEVVLSADGGVDFSRVQQVLELVRAAHPQHLALEITSLNEAGGGGPPVDGDVTKLGDLSEDDLAALKPKRYKFPQDPYSNVASFTAYTLEWGEWKIGLGTVSVGILPRTQIGTAEALDFAGAFNVYGKADIARAGPLDGALIVQYYRAPQWILNLATESTGLATEDLKISGSYLGLGALASLRLAAPWTLHTSVYYARPTATGIVSFDALPALLFPGLDSEDTGVDLDAKVTGDAVVLNLATDLRFNRRDSIYLWYRAPVYARARGGVSAESLGVTGDSALDNVDLIVGYGQAVNPLENYSFAFGYLAQWRHIEARIGWGFSAPVQGLWIAQAFDLSYRFGGPTKRNEHAIRSGYHDQKRDQRNAPVAPPQLEGR